MNPVGSFANILKTIWFFYITGQKAYGTFTRKDLSGKQDVKIYYEVLLFGQKGGLQQIMILREESDEYAKQIAERIMKSVELKKVQ